MIKYLITAGIWAGLSYPTYRYLGPIAVCVYGLVSMILLLLWAATRKNAAR